MQGEGLRGRLIQTLDVMKFLSLKHPPKCQSFWRAVVAAVVVHPLVLVGLGIVYWALRPFVWAAIYMEPYRSPPGPYSPNGGEWLFTQGIGFCASVVAGVVAAYWSPPRSYLPIAVLVAISFAFLPFSQFPFDTSAFRNTIYALQTPLGLVIGAVLLSRVQASSTRSLRSLDAAR